MDGFTVSSSHHLFSTKSSVLTCLKELWAPRKKRFANYKVFHAGKWLLLKIFTMSITIMRRSEAFLIDFIGFLLTLSLPLPIAEHLLCVGSLHFFPVFPQLPTGEEGGCHQSQREEPCSDPKLIKQQSLDHSLGWPVSKTYAFIMFYFIA